VWVVFSLNRQPCAPVQLAPVGCLFCRHIAAKGEFS
jgi:hypothetical protein